VDFPALPVYACIEKEGALEGPESACMINFFFGIYKIMLRIGSMLIDSNSVSWKISGMTGSHSGAAYRRELQPREMRVRHGFRALPEASKSKGAD